MPMSALSLLSINWEAAWLEWLMSLVTVDSLYATAIFRDPLEGNIGLNIRLRVFCVCI